ncbi:electron transport complex subunit RsxG [Polycyclovorans algicola]|uniref:electron transport complex subunit RsxG n=1 Tax=Polycyclovorans algicola TaxID=616992 RepID=UPI0004A72141|nr:electron transport complex subunit RsxG [Polycyclovorans algicola]
MSGAVHVRQMLKSGGLLAAFGVVTAALLAGVYGLTKDQIAAAQQARLLRELQAVLSAERYDNDLALDTLTLDDPRLGGRSTVYRARLDGRPAASIFTVVAPDGYSGDIRLLVGVTPDGTVTGVRVTEHRETPGLGDKIELRKNDWILAFTGRSLGDPAAERWTVRKDGGAFDQFTGATITPRAVVAAVARTLTVTAERQHEWWDDAPATTPDPEARDTP